MFTFLALEYLQLNSFGMRKKKILILVFNESEILMLCSHSVSVRKHNSKCYKFTYDQFSRSHYVSTNYLLLYVKIDMIICKGEGG